MGLPPYITLTVTQNNEIILDNAEYALWSRPLIIQEADYNAGDVFRINVGWDWGFGPEAQDYSVLVYSTQDLEVKDSNGETNMLHMDGQEPSGFNKWW